MNTPSSRIPKGLGIISHYHTKQEKINKVKLCTYARQNHGSWEEGNDIKKYVSNPLCDDVLDYFLDHPEEIPESWKGKLIFFWGTIYGQQKTEPLVVAGTNEEGQPEKYVRPFRYEEKFVRCLLFYGGKWTCDFLSLRDEFGPTRVSAELDTSRSLWDCVKDFFMLITLQR